MLRKQGGLPSVDGEWLELRVAVEVVEQLIDMARDHWQGDKRIKSSTLDWKGFWLWEDERQGIVADAVKGYLAAESPISTPRWY